MWLDFTGDNKVSLGRQGKRCVQNPTTKNKLKRVSFNNDIFNVRKGPVIISRGGGGWGGGVGLFRGGH